MPFRVGDRVRVTTTCTYNDRVGTIAAVNDNPIFWDYDVRLDALPEECRNEDDYQGTGFNLKELKLDGVQSPRRIVDNALG